MVRPISNPDSYLDFILLMENAIREKLQKHGFLESGNI